MKIKNLKDLKDFLNSLNDEQLQQLPIVINAPEESYIQIAEADVSEETFVYNEDTDGLIMIEDYDPEQYEGRTLDDPYNTIVPPGRVFIYEDCEEE